MIQVLLISILQRLVSFLQAAFAAKPKLDDDFFHAGFGGARGARGSHGTNTGSNLHHDLQLQEAYDALEIHPGATLDEVRKQWKKLSLRYHPDRNPGNEQAHHLQQRVNEAFQRIQMALEQGNDAGDDDPDDHDHDDQPNASDHSDDDRRPPPPPPTKAPPRQQPYQHHHQQQQQQQQYQGKSSKQRRRKYQATMKKQHDEMRKELEKELQREQREKREKYQTVRKEQQRIRRETIRLADDEQREAASRRFMDQVRLRREQFQQQQQQQRQQSPHVNPLGPCDDKPKNFVMESCTNELVLAMRMEMDEFAAEILDDQINESIQWHLHNPTFLFQNQQRRRFVTFEQLLSLVMPKILLQRLDEDQNTLLHYALYWERPTMVQVFCDLANRHGILEQVIMAKNTHGHIAMDLAWVAKNPYILALMQSQETLLQMHKERTQLRAALKKAANQLWIAIRHKFDPMTVLNSWLAFGVANWGLSIHWSLALLGVAALQSPQSFSWMVPHSTLYPSTNLAFFLSFLICVKLTWISTTWCYHYMADYVSSIITWQLLLLLIPAGILCGCTGSWFSWDLVRAVLFFWSTGYETLLYLPLLDLEHQLFKRSWKQIPPSIRKRPVMVHTLILFGMLGATGLIQQVLA